MTSWPGAADAFGNPTPTTPLDDPTLTHSTQHGAANDAIEAMQTHLGITSLWENRRQAWLGTAADHGADDSNDGLSANTPVATMAQALETLKPQGGTKPVGVVWVLPGRYSITAGNEWRINQRVAVINAQWAHGTGPADPPVTPESKVVVEPADAETLTYLVALGEPIWNGAATDRYWHGGMFEGIMVYGREDDATFTGTVDYGVWVHQMGENSTINRSRVRACRVANWRFTGTAAGGTIMDIGTWNPGIGTDSEPGTGGIGILQDDGGLGDGQSGSLHFDHVSGDSRRSADTTMFRIMGSCGVSVNKIKAEGWLNIVDTSDTDNQQNGFFHCVSLSWNPAVNSHHVTDEAVIKYRYGNSRFPVRVGFARITSGAPNWVDWSSRDADAIMPHSVFGKNIYGGEVHSKTTLYPAGDGNWSGKFALFGDVSLGMYGYLLDTADGNFNPWLLWEYTTTGILQWRNPDADGYRWGFESDTITEYDGAGVTHLSAGNAQLWSSYQMALDGTVSSPAVTWTPGTGSPEGVVTANVGSLYSRTDGGAGTSLYVKESGTGNTGWVAK